MNRETRANLIFVGVLLAVLAPGAVILVRKKLAGGRAPLAQPDPVLMEAAYCDADNQRPGVRRVVPRRTEDWVRWLTRGQLPAEVAGRAVRYTGRISRERGFEVTAAARLPDGGLVLGVLAWDRGLAQAGREARFRLDGRELAVLAASITPVPDEVRAELQALAFVQPPQTVGWFELRAAPLAAPPASAPADDAGGGRRSTLVADYPTAAGAVQDTCAIELPE